MKILGISGSLREGSLNTALLQATENFLHSNIQLEIKNIGKIPLYNEDIDEDKIPEEVTLLISEIAMPFYFLRLNIITVFLVH